MIVISFLFMGNDWYVFLIYLGDVDLVFNNVESEDDELWLYIFVWFVFNE